MDAVTKRLHHRRQSHLHTTLLKERRRTRSLVRVTARAKPYLKRHEQRFQPVYCMLSVNVQETQWRRQQREHQVATRFLLQIAQFDSKTVLFGATANRRKRFVCPVQQRVLTAVFGREEDGQRGAKGRGRRHEVEAIMGRQWGG